MTIMTNPISFCFKFLLKKTQYARWRHHRPQTGKDDWEILFAIACARAHTHTRTTGSSRISVNLKLALRLLEVLHHGLDRADLEPPLAGKSDAALAAEHPGLLTESLARHLGAVVNQLRNHSGRLLAGQTTQVNGGLGVTRALADAAGLGAQGEDVARTAQRLGALGLVGEHAAHERAVVGADACGDRGVGSVDRDGVGGRPGVLVVDDHLGELELDGALGQDGRADEAGRVAHHEGHLLGGDGLGGDDQVRLVLAAGVVEHDDELAFPCWQRAREAVMLAVL